MQFSGTLTLHCGPEGLVGWGPRNARSSLAPTGVVAGLAGLALPTPFEQHVGCVLPNATDRFDAVDPTFEEGRRRRRRMRMGGGEAVAPA